MHKKHCLRGKSLRRNAFEFRITERLPSEQWTDIAAGRQIGEIVKGFLSPDACEAIRRNFENSSSIRKRTDGVPGETLGVDLYKSAPEEYVVKSLMLRADCNRLFQGTVNVPIHLRESLQRTIPKRCIVRPAIYNGIEFNPVRAIRWTDNGNYALKFHDDQAQLGDPWQKDMETSRISYPVAFNVYPSVSENGGALVVYNIAPSEQSRAELGLSFTGYPYPEELLKDFERIEVAPEAGDLVILSGRFVHGVTGIGGATPRILLNHFGGNIDSKTFVTWS
jgi:hypothetical protein